MWLQYYVPNKRTKRFLKVGFWIALGLSTISVLLPIGILVAAVLWGVTLWNTRYWSN